MAGLFIEVDGVLIAPLEAGAPNEQAALLPGVGAALARLRQRGVTVVAMAGAGPSAGRFPALGAQLRRAAERDGGELRGCYAVSAQAPTSWRWPRPGMLLAAARELGLDLSQCWMVASDRDAVAAAAQAGCPGCVLVAQPDQQLPVDARLVVAVARDLADAPRVMIPRSGGCWHQ